jgi:basic amino acid/polyamine antiporter, APA family
VAGLFIYRAREPNAAFRVPGYPWTPAVFVLAAAYVVVSVVVSNPKNGALGAALIATGVPVFFYWRRRGAAIR